MNKFNNMIEEMKENAWKHFGWRLAEIACSVLDRLDEEEMEKDKCEAILSAMDDELIYTSDQWEIIQYYMNPDEIGQGKTLSDVMMEFFEELMRL
jgi:hypothetical protein